VPFLSALFAAQPEGPPLNAVATDSYVGERSDCPPLNALFLAAPVAFKAASSSTPDGCPPGRAPPRCTPTTPSRPAWSPPPWPNARLHHPSGSRSPSQELVTILAVDRQYPGLAPGGSQSRIFRCIPLLTSTHSTREPTPFRRS